MGGFAHTPYQLKHIYLLEIQFGSSVIIDPWGETILEAGEKEEALLTATIDVDKVDEIRGRMKVLEDRRPDIYELGHKRLFSSVSAKA